MTPQQQQQLVQEAMQKQQAGDLEGAVTGYREFLKLHPEALRQFIPTWAQLWLGWAGLKKLFRNTRRP